MYVIQHMMEHPIIVIFPQTKFSVHIYSTQNCTIFHQELTIFSKMVGSMEIIYLGFWAKPIFKL